MLSSEMPRTLEHVEKSGDVRVDVGLRILQRIADAGLSGQMHDTVGAFAFEDLRNER